MTNDQDKPDLAEQNAKTGAPKPGTAAPSMIERVAREIYESRNGPGCKPWSRQPNAHQDPYLTDARAAIFGMREPSDAMLAAVVPLPLHLIEERKDVEEYESDMRTATAADRLTFASKWNIAIAAALKPEVQP